MKISYTYRPTYLISFGIAFIIGSNVFLFSLSMMVYNDFSFNEVKKGLIILILILLVEPLIILYGGHNIIEGNNQFKIQFTEVNFKSYKNLQLELKVPVEKIKRINIIYGKVFFTTVSIGFEYFEINIEFKDREKVQLYIRNKKWISKFLEFIKLLEEYCSEEKIEIIKSTKGFD